MTETIRLVPAVLTEDPKVLETMIHQAESFSSYVQFDIMDGHFVPSRSITCKQLIALPIKFSWEAHLMVVCPEDYLEDLRRAGAQKIVFHHEATSSPRKVISQARKLGLEVGLAINPETAVPVIQPLLSEVDSVLVLTVHPGFYGNQFIPEVLDKIVELHSVQPDIEIGVDGGIKESNITMVARAEADVIYVGSAIFMQIHPGESFNHLLTLAQEGSRQRKQ